LEKSLSGSLDRLLGRTPSLVSSPRDGFAKGKRGHSFLSLGSTKSVHSGDVTERLKKMDTHIFHGNSSCKVHDVYEIGEEIGKGAFGVVYSAKDRATGHTFCCKTVRKDSLTERQLGDVKLEAEIMLHLRGHPNVVDIMGVFEDDDHLYIVEEMCTGGDLAERLAARSKMTEREAAWIMQQVLSVVEHCHNMGVHYRDIKLENFLLLSPEPDSPLKATDFGVSIFLCPDQQCEEFCGTPAYMAPEVFDLSYSYPSDVWSCGVMMYFILSGEFPFKGKNDLDLAYHVCSAKVKFEGEAWSKVSEAGKDLLRRMLARLPKDRLTAHDALKHEWFQKQGACDEPLCNTVLARMRAYSRMSRFKREVMRIIIRDMDMEYLVGLKAMFSGMDADNNGVLSVQEIIEALEKQGAEVAHHEVQQLVKEMDIDGNGHIDYEEFLAAALNRSLLDQKDLLLAAFKHFDKDGDGFITKVELLEGLSYAKVDEAQISAMVDAVDSDKNGKVDFLEFTKMMFEDYEDFVSHPRPAKRLFHKKARLQDALGKGESCAIM